MGYQTTGEEIDIVARDTDALDSRLGSRAVAVVRATRIHPDVRVGSSVRGAIDLVLLAGQLAGLRDEPISSEHVGLRAALAALSGRIRVHESSARPPESIIEELWAATAPGADDGTGDQGKA